MSPSATHRQAVGAGCEFKSSRATPRGPERSGQATRVTLLVGQAASIFLGRERGSRGMLHTERRR